VKSAIYAENRPGTLLNLRDAARTSTAVDDDMPMAGSIGPQLVAHPEANHVFVEQYRRLGAALHHAQDHDGVRSVMVASAIEAEGKTLGAANLALVLSRSFRKRVLLVDADLRKPSIHQLLQLPDGPGLSDYLAGPGTLPVHTFSSTLWVITGGRHEPDPVALFVSDGLSRLLHDARDRFDWIIVDTPPVLLFPDAGLLADRLDTCVMVIRAATTTSPVAVKAVEAIGRSRILGVALNRADPSEVNAGCDYGSYGYPANKSNDARAWWRTGRGRS
jgi:capsular exopolysaccharide synthesis family protein